MIHALLVSSKYWYDPSFVKTSTSHGFSSDVMNERDSIVTDEVGDDRISNITLEKVVVRG
jgi:hypothetical protein